MMNLNMWVVGQDSLHYNIKDVGAKHKSVNWNINVYIIKNIIYIGNIKNLVLEVIDFVIIISNIPPVNIVKRKKIYKFTFDLKN